MGSWSTSKPKVKWTTSTDDYESKFPSSKAARAKKRLGAPVGDNLWEVYGDAKLSDSYDTYLVEFDPDTKRYRCDCSHYSGQYASSYGRMCTHMIYVMFARKGIVEFAGGHEESPLSDSPVSGLLTPFSEADPRQTSFDAEDIATEFHAPNNPDLPSWVTELRPAQIDAVQQVSDLYDQGKKVVFLDAPTGAGKTLIGELVRRKIAPLP